MRRRGYLGALGAVGATALAGCGGLFETESVGEPAVFEDRPDAVYVPTHVEGMTMIDVATAGRLRLALSYSFPHRFWTMDGNRTNRVDVQDDDSVHLMVSAWDAETGISIPSSTANLAITRDGDLVEERRAWPMLSQNMGFHYGDNVSLDGDGTYDVAVTFGPVGSRRTGDFRGPFGDRVSRSVPFEFSQDERDDITFERLEDREGERDALDPMQMEMLPVHQLPPAEDLPGTALGQGSVGDASIVGTLLESPPEGVSGRGPYLAVSPRTPYNRYPIPFMPLSATVTAAGTEAFADSLRSTLDPDLGYHLGAVVEGMGADASVRVTVDNAAQVARHEGYETAFLENGSVELTGDGSQ
jgi:hypothetical protein